MTTENRKIQIPVTVDTTDAKPGFEDLKQAGREAAQSLQQSSQQASQAVDKIGDGAGASAQKIDKASKSIADSIKRVPAAAAEGARATDGLSASQSRYLTMLERQGIIAERGKAAYHELRAAQLGIGDAAAASIAKIRTAEVGIQSVGMSAKATSAALRGVPAQFTDIFTSIQGGQAPLTVLLQQGGQLKDMFGGIGPAAKALGGYVLGLVTPFTVGAAALAAIAYGAHAGSEELRAFQHAATLTGNAIGLSASQFASLRDSIAGITGTGKGKAAEALTEIARTGQLAGQNVQGIAQAAILMEKATGQAISKTVAEFVKLADEPAKAAVELNKQTNFLTTSLYSQIKALEDSGQKADAARLAMEAFADVTKQRTAGIVENVGIIEKSWHAVLNTIKQIVDAVKDIGRTQTPEQRLAVANADVARVEQQIAGLGKFGETGGGAATGGANIGGRRIALERDLELARERMRGEQRVLELSNSNAAAEAARAEATKLGIASYDRLSKMTEQAASKQLQLNDALKQYRADLVQRKADNPNAKDKFGRSLFDPAVVRATEADLRKKFAPETTGESEVAKFEARKKSQEALLKRLEAQLASGNFAEPVELTPSETARDALVAELKKNISGKARAEKRNALAVVESTIAIDKDVEAQKRQNKAVQQALELQDKRAGVVGQQADAIALQAQELDASNAVFGKGKIAIEQYLLAQDRISANEDGKTDRFYANLDAKINARTDLIEKLQVAEDKQLTQKNKDLSRDNAAETELLRLEFSLVGQTQEARERIVAARRIELEYAKKLQEVDQSGATDAAKAARRAEIEAEKQVAIANSATKETLTAWQRTADSIEQSLTDALLRGFESGKGFASNLRDTVTNMFKTLVLKPVIQAVLSPISGSLTGVAQSFGQSITGGGSGLLSNLGSASSLTNLGSLSSTFAPAGGMIDTGLGLFGAGSGIGGAAISGAEIAATAGATDAALVAAGASMAEAGTAAAALGSSMGAATGALAAMGPVGWVGLAALAAYSIFGGGGGGPKVESGFGAGVTNVNPAESQKIAQAIQQQYAGLATTFGATPDKLDLGIFSAKDPEGDSPTQLQLLAAMNGATLYDRSKRVDTIENIGRSDEEFSKAVSEETTRTVFAAIKATGSLTQSIKDILEPTDAYKGSIEEIQKALEKAQVRKGLEDRLFDLTATDAQKLTKVRDAERRATDATNLALLEQIYRQEDLKKATEDVVASLTQAIASYRTSDASGIGRGEALAQVQTALAIAKAGGPAPDAEKLKDAINVLGQPAEQSFATRAAFMRSRDAEAQLLRELQDQYESARTEVSGGGAVVASAVNSGATFDAMAQTLQAMRIQLDESNRRLADLTDSNERMKLVLEGAAYGGAPLGVETSS